MVSHLNRFRCRCARVTARLGYLRSGLDVRTVRNRFQLAFADVRRENLRRKIELSRRFTFVRCTQYNNPKGPFPVRITRTYIFATILVLYCTPLANCWNGVAFRVTRYFSSSYTSILLYYGYDTTRKLALFLVRNLKNSAVTMVEKQISRGCSDHYTLELITKFPRTINWPIRGF